MWTSKPGSVRRVSAACGSARLRFGAPRPPRARQRIRVLEDEGCVAHFEVAAVAGVEPRRRRIGDDVAHRHHVEERRARRLVGERRRTPVRRTERRPHARLALGIDAGIALREKRHDAARRRQRERLEILQHEDLLALSELVGRERSPVAPRSHRFRPPHDCELLRKIGLARERCEQTAAAARLLEREDVRHLAEGLRHRPRLQRHGHTRDDHRGEHAAPSAAGLDARDPDSGAHREGERRDQPVAERKAEVTEQWQPSREIVERRVIRERDRERERPDRPATPPRAPARSRRAAPRAARARDSRRPARRRSCPAGRDRVRRLPRSYISPVMPAVLSSSVPGARALWRINSIDGSNCGAASKPPPRRADQDGRERCDRNAARAQQRAQQRRAACDRRRERRHHHGVGPADEDLQTEDERRVSPRGPRRVARSRGPRRAARPAPTLRCRAWAASRRCSTVQRRRVEQAGRDASDGGRAEAARQHARQRRGQRDVREREPRKSRLRRQRQMQPVGRIQHARLQRAEERPAESLVRIPQREVTRRRAA